MGITWAEAVAAGAILGRMAKWFRSWPALALLLACTGFSAASGRGDYAAASFRELLFSLPSDWRTREAAAYADAMRRYALMKRAQFRPAAGYPLVDGSGPPPFVPWLWTDGRGSAIVRVSDGRFLVTFFDPRRNWSHAIDCRVEGWPDLVCSDGRTAVLRAPDPSRVVFDGREFTRVLPEPPDEAASAVDYGSGQQP